MAMRLASQPAERVERRVSHLPFVRPRATQFGKQRPNVRDAGPCDPLTCRGLTHASCHLGEREILVVELLDEPQQPVRVPRREERHTSNGAVPGSTKAPRDRAERDLVALSNKAARRSPLSSR